MSPRNTGHGTRNQQRGRSVGVFAAARAQGGAFRGYWTPPIRCSRQAHAWFVVARVKSWFRSDRDPKLLDAEHRFVGQFRQAYGRPGAALAWVAVYADRALFAVERWWWTPR